MGRSVCREVFRSGVGVSGLRVSGDSSLDGWRLLFIPSAATIVTMSAKIRMAVRVKTRTRCHRFGRQQVARDTSLSLLGLMLEALRVLSLATLWFSDCFETEESVGCERKGGIQEYILADAKGGGDAS